MNFDELKDKAISLPQVPGVYIMRDKNDTVIYVGKAKKLKNRVSQYFVDTVWYLAAVLSLFGVLFAAKQYVMPQVTIASFILMFVLVCVLFNGVFFLLFGRREEFKYLWGIVAGKLKK